MSSDSYLYNSNVKRDGIKHQFTKNEIKEYLKCSKSPVYFAQNYIKIINLDEGLVPFDPYVYQRKMLRHMSKNRFSIILACRQSGKCAQINSIIRVKHKETLNEEDITVGEFHKRVTQHSIHIMNKEFCDDRSVLQTSKLSDTVERKFIEVNKVNDYLIWTDTGWEDIESSNKTIPYQKWRIKFNDGKYLDCADTHILIQKDGTEVFAMNSIGCEIQTESGPSRVTSVIPMNEYENMFDLSINSDNHTYYTNGILSHNSITSCAYLLWVALFQPEQTIGLLANKAAVAKEMLSRITLMLEHIPFFLQPGCKALNKLSIEFSNNSKIFAASTSSSSIRGMSCNVIFLDEFAFVNKASEFYTSTYPVISSGMTTKVIITSTPNGIGNMFYKIWEGAMQKSNEFKPFRVDWWDVPGRGKKWKKQTIANTSQIQFDQEYGNCLESNSEITIRINNIRYDIRIGDLYDAIMRGKEYSCGLSINEEVRLSAIRWYND